MEENNKVIALREAIQEGINSEIVEGFNPKEFLEILKARKTTFTCLSCAISYFI